MESSEAPRATGPSRTRGKSRGARMLGRVLRAPGGLDRRGVRWMLQLLSPATVIVLLHRGRKSGRLYRTPIEILGDGTVGDRFVVAPLYGPDSDWYRNVVAGGLDEVHARGEEMRVEWRELDEEGRRAALAAYRKAYPLYSRVAIRAFARANGLKGDREQAIVDSLPMLELRRAAS